ncbi:MAG: hypothetical protein QOC79_2727 [Actinomycetota bacterium]|nr:hypothetical protein [Actinomycetota bacterium]
MPAYTPAATGVPERAPPTASGRITYRRFGETLLCAQIGVSLRTEVVGAERASIRQLCTSGGEPITRPVLLRNLLSRLIGGIVGWLWLDGETQRADLTAADFLVRGSVAVGVFAVLLWLIFR